MKMELVQIDSAINACCNDTNNMGMDLPIVIKRAGYRKLIEYASFCCAVYFPC